MSQKSRNKIFLERLNMIIKSDKLKKNLNRIPSLLEMGSHIATIVGVGAIVIAVRSYTVSQNQLKITEYQNSPIFKITVSTEFVDDLTRDQFIQVTNLGQPINADIETYAMMIVKMQDEGKKKEINILLNGYFYETTDMIENGTSMTDVLCRRGTNLCDSYVSGVMLNARKKINDAFVSRNIFIDHEIFYFTKISYKDYHEVSKYYLVGNFENKEIEKSEFTKLLKTRESLDVGNYLNAPIDNELMAIIMKNIS